ncbi:peptidase inhibitor family I36 protein [Nocardia sp. NPDC058518]|uniref:peptidase inhibitor family I36 protein n=1 Tax=Nocardia sp. NPDC058518 TaxID=3346534 RepID=UPI00365A1E73
MEDQQLSKRITLAAAVIGAAVSAATLVVSPPANAQIVCDKDESVCLWDTPNFTGRGIPISGSTYDLPTHCVSAREYISDPNLRIRSVGNNMAASIAVWEGFDCNGRQRIISRGEWVADIGFDAHSWYITLAA